ncbi:ATP-binding protein [Streptomyces sp. LD120]|uniref:ATP-binding protein n=1 Tax=Streptomyces physcomitrii TaxID=2724184 RepID=A0ABX1GWG2_9ACTN|nr:ATP-binding protein [Streptomyces physcomitrii]
MDADRLRQLPLRVAQFAPLEPVKLATSERFRSLVLVVNSPDTAQVARRTAREVARDWRLSTSPQDMELCVSELVGNAFHHATPDGRFMDFGGERRITVSFRAWSRWLFIEVADEDSTPPMLPVGELMGPNLSRLDEDELLPTYGRGLFLVQLLADAVWWAPHDSGGKSVFCRFDLDTEGQ